MRKWWADVNTTGGGPPSDFNSALWNVGHTDLMAAVKLDLREQGYRLYEQAQNALALVDKTGAVLTGRADLITIRDDTALVIDCKTGQYRRSHGRQVLLYMHLLRHPQCTHPAHACRSIHGRVQYQHATADIPGHVTKIVPELLRRHMPVLLQKTAPDPTPSYSECRFCPLGPELCSERIETEPSPLPTNLF